MTPPSPYYDDGQATLLLGDALQVLRTLPDASVNCCVTSPPYYWLRDYGQPGQYGLEESPDAYVARMQAVFHEVRRILTPDGTLWLNLGDSYSSAPSGRPGATSTLSKGTARAQASAAKRTDLPLKNLIGIPWRVALALQADGWILRNEIIWHKTNGMPESVKDRLASRHEHVFMLAKEPRYYFDLDAIREPHKRPNERRIRTRVNRGEPRGSHPQQRRAGVHPNGRNPGDVWDIATRPYTQAHFAVFPPAIPTRAILAGCPPGGTVLDPFSGSGTTGAVATQLGRRYVGIDLNPDYHDLAIERLTQANP